MQDDFSMPLIHTACRNGEMDTLSELIEVKGVDPCMVDKVSEDKLSAVYQLNACTIHRAMAVSQYI